MLDFRIKICGITTPEDAVKVYNSGADAIGLNFYASSSRSVEIAAAVEIADATRGKLKLVGLFVDHPIDLIRQTSDALQLDYIQLHGNEHFLPAQWDAQFWDSERPWPALIRALRWPAKSTTEANFIEDWCSMDAREHLAAYLIDANVSGMVGGTGVTTEWKSLLPRPSELANRPMILAGGLNSENVAEAIAVCQPNAVDTASGVESAPGRKDVERLQRFAVAAFNAFSKLKP